MLLPGNKRRRALYEREILAHGQHYIAAETRDLRAGIAFWTANPHHPRAAAQLAKLNQRLLILAKTAKALAARRS